MVKAEQCDGTDSTILCNPLKTDSFTALMESISQLAVQIGIPIAAIFIIYSGLKLVTARGNEESIKKSQNGLVLGHYRLRHPNRRLDDNENSAIHSGKPRLVWRF